MLTMSGYLDDGLCSKLMIAMLVACVFVLESIAFVPRTLIMKVFDVQGSSAHGAIRGFSSQSAPSLCKGSHIITVVAVLVFLTLPRLLCGLQNGGLPVPFDPVGGW